MEGAVGRVDQASGLHPRGLRGQHAESRGPQDPGHEHSAALHEGSRVPYTRYLLLWAVFPPSPSPLCSAVLTAHCTFGCGLFFFFTPLLSLSVQLSSLHTVPVAVDVFFFPPSPSPLCSAVLIAHCTCGCGRFFFFFTPLLSLCSAVLPACCPLDLWLWAGGFPSPSLFSCPLSLSSLRQLVGPV